jgi:protoheme IX farnesyltransferase
MSTTTLGNTITATLRDYWALGKPRLSLLVAFSAAAGAYTVPEISVGTATAIVFGGLLITFSANATNQMLERGFDALMKRTSSRPLPEGRLSDEQALGYAFLTGLAGLVWMLWHAKPAAAFFSALSFMLYVWVYTPLKRVSPAAVWVGAIPGALPPLIGRAGAGELDAAAWTLFTIQFFWQLPHFWAIAKLGEEDYRKAGFKMRPPGGVGLHAWISALPLVGAGWAARSVGLVDSALPLTVLGIIYAAIALYFYMRPARKRALILMFASFFYLPAALGWIMYF